MRTRYKILSLLILVSVALGIAIGDPLLAAEGRDRLAGDRAAGHVRLGDVVGEIFAPSPVFFLLLGERRGESIIFFKKIFFYFG